MSDTMRDLFPAEVRFVGGENPSDRKLTNWALMEKDALTLLAQAVGNIWNIDKTLQDRAADPHPLLFTNLTRAIGNLELLNPAFLYGYTISQHTQQLAAGHTEHQLNYWVDLPENYTAQDLLNAVYAAGPGGELKDDALTLDLAHTKLTPEELSAAGDWTVLGRTLYTYSGASGGYFIWDAVWKLPDVAASFSVIPNLTQLIADGGMQVTKITGAEETYYVLATPTYLYDYDGNPAHASFADKQIPLPAICQYSADQLIPEGLVTLWDLGSPPAYANAQKVEGALFYGYGDEYHIVVKNVTLEEDNQRYVLVCAAEGLAYAVRQLRNHIMAILNGDPETHDIHGRLRNLRFTGQDTQGNLIAGWFPFPRSRVLANDHSMYLHRMGFDPEDTNIWGNAMLGDLMLASSNPADGWLNLLADSNKIQFGSATGPTIFYQQAAGGLEADTILIRTHNHSGAAGMGMPVAGQYQVKVDAADVLGGYLEDKLQAGDNVDIIETDVGGGVKKLRISAAGGAVESSKVKVDAGDSASGYLSEKLVAGNGISLSVEAGGVGKVIRLGAATGISLQEAQGLIAAPNLEWVDFAQVRVPASESSPAKVMLCGFPNILNPGQLIDGGLTDNKYRENTNSVTMDFGVANNLWGVEKSHQWYAVFAVAPAAAGAFTLKAMPLLRVKSHAGQVISLGSNYVVTTAIGYGFATNELAGSKIYVLSGDSKGALRSITANDNSTSAGTITYGGSALSLAQGDWFIVLPHTTNFRFLGTIYNDGDAKIRPFVKRGSRVRWYKDQVVIGGSEEYRRVNAYCPLASVVSYYQGLVDDYMNPDSRSYTEELLEKPHEITGGTASFKFVLGWEYPGMGLG